MRHQHRGQFRVGTQHYGVLLAAAVVAIAGHLGGRIAAAVAVQPAVDGEDRSLDSGRAMMVHASSLA